MNLILFTVECQLNLVYYDNIVIISKTLEQITEDIRSVLSLLNSTGATLKLKKSNIFATTVDYLGHGKHLRALELACHATGAKCGLKTLTSFTKSRSFLELCNTFRPFVSNFAQITPLLIQRLKREQLASFLLFNRESLIVIENLKKALTTPPVLALLSSGGDLTLDTGACSVYIRCVLLQKQLEEPTNPIEYWSWSLTKTKLRYDTTQRESLVFVWLIPLLHPCHKENRFKICSDRFALN